MNPFKRDALAMMAISAAEQTVAATYFGSAVTGS
jgi:hypothetical protein